MEEQNNLKAIDLHNKVTGEELERLLKMQLSALAEDPRLAHELPPLMGWGAPGLGKSSILKDVAKELGIGFIDVRLAQREPVDIRGLPVPGKDGVKWLVASEWPRDPKSRGIILFDEITAADRSLSMFIRGMVKVREDSRISGERRALILISRLGSQKTSRRRSGRRLSLSPSKCSGHAAISPHTLKALSVRH